MRIKLYYIKADPSYFKMDECTFVIPIKTLIRRSLTPKTKFMRQMSFVKTLLCIPLIHSVHSSSANLICKNRYVSPENYFNDEYRINYEWHKLRLAFNLPGYGGGSSPISKMPLSSLNWLRLLVRKGCLNFLCRSWTDSVGLVHIMII